MVTISGAYGKLKTWVNTQIAAHKADTGAHHTKYTDAEAVNAVAIGDDYLKNIGDVGNGSYKFNIPYGMSNKFELEIDFTNRFDYAFYMTRKNAPPGFFGICNKSSPAGYFIPTFYGQAVGYTGFGLIFVALMTAANDVKTDTRAAIILQAERVGESVLQADHVLLVRNFGETLVIVSREGNVSIGPSGPTCKLDVQSDKIRLRTAKTPATSGASGNTGDICWDADYIYVCTATNTWKRVAIATW